MKKLLIILIFPLVVLASCKKEAGGDIHTPVKLALADSCYIYDAQVDELMGKRYYTYNAYGMPQQERVSYNLLIQVDSLYKRIFDTRRNVLSEERYIYKNDFWNTASKSVYTYDQYNRVLTEEQYDGYGDASNWEPKTRVEYGYGADSLVIKCDKYTYSGTWILTETQSAAIDSETGLCTSIIKYTVSDGVKTPVKKIEYERDDAGNPITMTESEYSNGDYLLKYKSTLEYDALYYLVREDTYVRSGDSWTQDGYITYKRTGNGDISERIFYVVGTLAVIEAVSRSVAFNEAGKVINISENYKKYSYRDISRDTDGSRSTTYTYGILGIPDEILYTTIDSEHGRSDQQCKYFNSVHTY